MARMLPLRECTGPLAAEVGPKARRLAEALRRGVAVPDGLIVLPDEQLPEPRLLKAALDALFYTQPALPVLPVPEQDPSPALATEGAVPEPQPPRFAVRSTAVLEDQPGRSAAGLFRSRLNVPAEEVAAAIRDVRASGQSEAVRLYAGGPVRVAVLVQPMVAAERLGVLLLDEQSDQGGSSGPALGTAVCEERPFGMPEWGDVTVRGLSLDDPSPLVGGGRALAALLAEELGRPGEALPVLIEYALGPTGAVTFLQVRPAPPSAGSSVHQAWRDAVPEPLRRLELLFDRDHNPDPLSAAQAGLVEVLDDEKTGGTPGLVQVVVRGYLFYAATATRAPMTPLAELPRRYRDEIKPDWEAALRPLEARLAAPDGALRPDLAAEMRSGAAVALARELPLHAAFQAYRSVFVRYVGELQPVLRRARAHLDQLLRSNLGEPLAMHGALLGGIGGAQTERLQALWQLGRAGVPLDELRRYLARHGAWAPAWDVACACDDEQPERIRQQAQALAREARSPGERHEAAQEPFHAALQALLDRLPRMARGALKALLPQVRAALVIAEEDDALFSRSQRLVRWALLLRGAALAWQGRLRDAHDVFDLPLTLHQPAIAGPFDAAALAPGVDLRELAAQGAAARQAARVLWPPSRIMQGRPYFAISQHGGDPGSPTGALGSGGTEGAPVLRGFGVPGAGGGPVRGRARVVRGLDEAAAVVAHAADLSEDEILVLPVLLPSWAPALFRARALVTDSGGALGHGALLAREAGVPAVLGTRDATRRIAPGQGLLVDGDLGRVYLV